MMNGHPSKNLGRMPRSEVFENVYYLTVDVADRGA